MAKECKQAGGCRIELAQAEGFGKHACCYHRNGAFECVPDKGQDCGFLVSAAQDICGARVAGSVLARVFKSHGSADKDGKRNGAEKVGHEGDEGCLHRLMADSQVGA
ncbi:hypothetical protein GCM10025771_19240 [Niveibacterium umoris]